MLRPLIAATATAATLLLLASGPAHAQKQEYPSWVYDEMVPTGPYLRNMEQAQPVPGPRPSHWGAISKNGQFRAGMAEYGTDPKASTRSYNRTHSLTPPPVDVRRGLAPPQTGEAPATPRAVQLPN